MAGNWFKVTLDQIKAPTPNAIAMGPFGSRIKTDNFVPFGVPVIRGGNLNAARLHDDDFVFLTEEKADELRASNARPGDIVITHRGTIGQVGIIPFDARYPRYVVSQSQMKFTVDVEKADPYFIFYFLRSSIGQHQLLANTSQVGVPAIAQPTSSVKAIEILLPPTLAEQRAISRTLSILDDKIELIRRTNETLDCIARAIFKSWFIDFEPVRAKNSGESVESICRRLGLTPELLALFPDRVVDSELGEIPEGWTTGSVYEMAAYINGAAYSAFAPNEIHRGLPIIKIAELKAGVTSQTKYSDVEMPEKFRINIGDILFSWSGNPDTSIDTFVWANGPAWLNQHIFRVVPPNEYERSFVLVMLKQLRPVFAEMARNKQTTGLGHVTVSDLKRLRYVRPPKLMLVKWHEVINSILDLIFRSEIEARTLASCRDELLPELLSGSLPVPVMGSV
jgi:type I restriction enzyme S subunit